MTSSLPFWASLALGALAVSACGDDATYTPDACPPQHEYDIRELYAEENRSDPDVAKERAAIEAEVAEAAEEGCLTRPTHTPPLDE